MAPLVRRSILKKFLIVASCLAVCVPTPLALAQHPSNRTKGPTVKPPMFGAPRIRAIPGLRMADKRWAHPCWPLRCR
jgi:hypothetical protein